MNETELHPPIGGSTDGDAPRLPGGPIPAAPSLPSAHTPAQRSTPMLPNLPPVAPPVLDAAPALPLVSPVLSDDAAMLPTLPSLPNFPNPSVGTPHSDLQLPSELIDDVVAEAPEERRHPMAHLMPEITKPSEAALRAAELRNARKRKARRTKIIVGVVFLILAAVAGPPLVRWTIDAINESGSTKPEQPAESVPGTTLSTLDAMLTTPPTTVAGSATAP